MYLNKENKHNIQHCSKLQIKYLTKLSERKTFISYLMYLDHLNLSNKKKREQQINWGIQNSRINKDLIDKCISPDVSIMPWLIISSIMQWLN